MPTQPSPFFDSLLSRAELYLCLAKVFSAAELAQTSALIKTDLLPDFQSIAPELPALSSAWLQQFENALNATHHPEQLMADYSRLFLTPPSPVSLNLGFYLDAGVMGRSGDALETYYHQYALEKSPDFHDLSDHLSLNLQWFAWIFAGLLENLEVLDKSQITLKDAAEVISNYTLPAVQSLYHKAEAFTQEHAVNRVWLLLLQLTKQQLQNDLQHLADYLPEQSVSFDTTQKSTAEYISDSSVAEMQLACNRCQREFIADEVLGGMVSRLEEAGVEADHIKVCPECKGETTELSRMIPPGAKRFKQRA